jgi:hypothetical protein
MNLFGHAAWYRNMKITGKFLDCKTSFLLLAGLILMLMLPACDLFNPFQSAPQDAAPGEILFADDFSQPTGNWKTGDFDGALVEYRVGGMRILVNEAYRDAWSVAGKRFRDVKLGVESALINGPLDNHYGLICRYQNDRNYYVFLISSDGYAAVGKVRDGDYQVLGSGQMEYFEAIQQGNAVNQIWAECDGDQLTLAVNRQTVIETRDSDFMEGDVGLLAGAYETAGVDVFFDHFAVVQP